MRTGLSRPGGPENVAMPVMRVKLNGAILNVQV
jgi:hypothetical protein